MPEPTAPWPELRRDFDRDSIGATLVGGIVAGVIAVALTVSFAAFIFRDANSSDLRVGVGVVLAATVALALTVALGSGLAGSVAGVQEVTVAILGVAAARIAAETAPDERLGSVLAFMMAATLATGAFLWLLGRFRLGRLVRFVPLTVVGGFIAATGYLIVTGAISILQGSATGGVEVWPVVVPAVALAILFIGSDRMGAPPFVFPVSIVAAVAVLHVGIALSGVSSAEAAARGWLLGGPGSGALWSPTVLGKIADADLGTLLSQSGGIPTVAVVAALGLLLNLHSLETTVGRDLDFDKELRVAGVGNLLAGVVGGGPGYTYLSDTLLLQRLKVMRRGTALVAALAVGVALLVGPSLLVVVPTAVVAGLLLFLGVSFIIEWLWDARAGLPTIDRAALAGIVLVVAVLGLVQGIVFGLVVAILLFVVRYSRIDVVQHRYDLTAIRSRVDRSASQSAWLGHHGNRAVVIELRGFLFFGTAHGLVDTVTDHMETNSSLEWVVLDFSKVTGIDPTAAGALGRMHRSCVAHDCGLVLAGDEKTRRQLDIGNLSGGDDRSLHFAPDLDAAMAWCEDRLLEADEAPGDPAAVSLADAFGERVPGDVARELAGCFERIDLRDGDRIVEQGSPTRGLFFIESGRLTAVLESKDGERKLLSAMQAGSLLGEISLYGGALATASVVATGDATVARLSPNAFERLRVENPVAAAYLHELVAQTLVERLDRAEAAMRQLRE